MSFGNRSASKRTQEPGGHEPHDLRSRGRDNDPTSERFVREFVVQRPTGHANPYDDGKSSGTSGLLKSFWAQAALIAVVFAAVCYARAFQVCNDMSSSGKFYSTTTVSRCIRIAIRSPHHTFAQHQKAIEDEF